MGKTAKFRGRPKAFATKHLWKHKCGRVNSPGYGKTAKDVTMDNPQPSPKGPIFFDKKKIWVYGCSSQTKWQWVCIELGVTWLYMLKI